jgi:ATP-dependent Clp protease ATP-binding subunit ClpC
MMSGIPVNRIAQTESNKLANYLNSLKKSYWPKRSVMKIARSIQRNRAGLKDPNRPMVLYFLGQTGKHN